MDKEEAKKEIAKLVKEFLEYPKEILNKKSEFQIQNEFIDPLFEALGWDMRKDAERNDLENKGTARYQYVRPGATYMRPPQLIKPANTDMLNIIESKKDNINVLFQ